MKSRGIDVSHHNGKINWEKVKKAGMSFAYIRLGYSGYEGEIHLDKRFYENLSGAKNAGLNVGAYIYSYNRDEKSAKRTAKEAFEILKEKDLDLPIAFDVEETGHDIFTSKSKNEVSRVCLAFFDEIEALGMEGILYSCTYFIKNYIDMDPLKGIDVWIADYRDREGINCPYEGDFILWQYKGSEGRCDGVEGPCDLDILYKDFFSEGFYKKKYEALKKDIEDLISKYENTTAS